MSPARARTRKKSPPQAPAPTAPKGFPVHHLVPQHELLSEEESEATLRHLGTSRERLPRILLSDPGLLTDSNFRNMTEPRSSLKGRIVRIQRPSPTAGHALAYRVLVATTGD